MVRRFSDASKNSKKQPSKAVSRFSIEKGIGKPDERFEATNSLVRVYRNATPGQKLKEEDDKKFQRSTYKYRSSQATLNPEYQQQILTKSYSFIPDKMLGIEGREKFAHITIQYGMEDYDQTKYLELYRKISSFRPFTVMLGTVKKFPGTAHSSFDCPVWISVLDGTRELTDIRNAIRKIVQVKDSFPNYVPHINLAYVKKEYADSLVGNRAFLGMRIPINHIDLSMKDGSLLRVPLMGDKAQFHPNFMNFMRSLLKLKKQ